MNIELLHDGQQVAASARDQAVAAKAVVAGAMTVAATAAADHAGLSLSPRRFAAGMVMLAGLWIARNAVRLLPAEAPTRVFVTGVLDGMPLTWRDLAEFARQRPMPSADA